MSLLQGMFPLLIPIFVLRAVFLALKSVEQHTTDLILTFSSSHFLTNLFFQCLTVVQHPFFDRHNNTP